MLEDYYSGLFRASAKLTMWRYGLMAILVILLCVSSFISGYPLYAASVVALILQVVAWYLAYLIRKYNAVAHELQRIHLLESCLNLAFSVHEASHLMARVASMMPIQNTDAPLIKRDSDALKYYSPDTLLKKIHENAFWNHHSFYSCYRRYRVYAAVLVAVVIVCLIFALPLLDKGSSDTILRLAFSLFSFAVIYEFLDSSLNFKRSADAMLEIDNEACKMINNLSPESLVSLFAKYHFWKSTCGSVPKEIYDRLQSGLNMAWDKVSNEKYNSVNIL